MVKFENKAAYEKSNAEKKRLQVSFRRFITLNSNQKDIRKLLGVDVFTVREWIESNFIEGMSWGNYGKVWVIDHIVPLRLFDIFNEADMKLCWHYKNLMPLYKKDNEKINFSSISNFIFRMQKRATRTEKRKTDKGYIYLLD